MMQDHEGGRTAAQVPEVDTERRRWLKAGSCGCAWAALGLSLPMAGCSYFRRPKGVESYPPPVGGTGTTAKSWADRDKILARIKAPEFPPRDFDITAFGAVPDGKTEATEAIRKAIEACMYAGGGRVIVPNGIFSTGPIHLRTGVNLHLMRGARLNFLTETAKYPLVFTRWEGVECMNYSPLIYAFEQENIAVTGAGVLDGGASAQAWWPWCQGERKRQQPDRAALFEMNDNGVAAARRVFGQGHLLRPSFIQPYRCRNVLIEGVTIVGAPMWVVHPVLSSNVTVRGLAIESHGPNNDGCDPESCCDVLIEDCVFDSGDDCIAIKSGRNGDGRRLNVACENLVIRNCRMKDGHGGVVLGSECSGHIRNVFIEQCEMNGQKLARALRFKNNAVRGGVLENVFMRNVRVGTLTDAVLSIELRYEEGAKGPYKPVVRNVQMENVTCSASPRALFIQGFEGAEIDHIHLSRCHFQGLRLPDVLEHAGKVDFEAVITEAARS